MLRFGSTGAAVQRLQEALNLELGQGTPLMPDGLFGMKTHGRVTGFQSRHGLFPDGIVGPKTNGALAPLFELLVRGVPRPIPLPEDVYRRRIVNAALSALHMWGWSGPGKPPTWTGFIAQRILKDRTLRLRQGGESLATIFSVAGGDPVAQCLKIPAGMALMELSNDPKGYDTDEPDKNAYERDRDAYSAKRNAHDLPNWCGIFALYCVRTAGLVAAPWRNGGVSKNKHLRTIPPREVREGDIGILSPGGRNHHFVVIRRRGSSLDTVDGNAGAFHSVVAKTYVMDKPNLNAAIEIKVSGKPTLFFSAFPGAQVFPEVPTLPPVRPPSLPGFS